jgi:hypothetical protein
MKLSLSCTNRAFQGKPSATMLKKVVAVQKGKEFPEFAPVHAASALTGQ